MKVNIEILKAGGGFSQKYIEAARKKPGGSNVGKKTFEDGSKRTGPYAGPSGGAPKGSYPIPDLKHAKSALILAHNAPNPGGIKKAVYSKYPELKKDQEGGTLNENKYSAENQSGASGIKIKKENIGSFTATKKATGKSTEALTHSKNPLTKKRAVFALNARKWHHKKGGVIEYRSPLLNNLMNIVWD